MVRCCARLGGSNSCRGVFSHHIFLVRLYMGAFYGSLLVDLPVFFAGQYEASRLSAKGHHLLMLALMLEFNLTNEALVYIARIIVLHMPRARFGPTLCTTEYRLAKYFLNFKATSRRVHYCESCHARLERFIPVKRNGVRSQFPCGCAKARTGFMLLLDLEEEFRFRLNGELKGGFSPCQCILYFAFLSNSCYSWLLSRSRVQSTACRAPCAQCCWRVL